MTGRLTVPVAERVAVTVRSPSETAPELLARIVEMLPLGLVYLDPGQPGITANRSARDILGLPSPGIAATIPAGQLERLGIHRVSAERTNPDLPDEILGNPCRAVRSAVVEGPGGPVAVWRIEDPARVPAPSAEAVETGQAPVRSSAPPSTGHEFNNLLGRMICLAEEIQDQEDPRQIHERAEALIEMAELGARMVSRLMTMVPCPTADGPEAEINQLPGAPWRVTPAAGEGTPVPPATAKGSPGR